MFKYSNNIFKIAIPAMVENILQGFTGLVDSYLIAQVGLVAVSGVSIANNFLAIYQALFISLAAALSSVLVRVAQDREKNLFYQGQAIQLTLIVSILLAILSIVGGQFLLPLMNMDKEVLLSARQYLFLVGGGIVSLGMMSTLGAILRTQGKVQLPMYTSLIVNILNAILSALSIYIFKVGITGVALATVFSRFVGVVLLANNIPGLLSNSRLAKFSDKELLRIGIPAAGERLMMRMGDLVVLSMIIPLGTSVVAGNAIGETITQFNYLPAASIATAVIILLARLPEQEKVIFIKEAYILSVLTMLSISGFVLAISPYLILYFTNDNRAVEASKIVALFSVLGILSTSGTLIFTSVWQSLGNAKKPFYATAIGMWAIRVMVGYFITIILGVGYAGIWIATILDNVFRWAYLAVNYYKKAS